MRFDTFSFLDNHQYQLQPHSNECLVAAGVRADYSFVANSSLPEFQLFLDNHKGEWIFGHMSYELSSTLHSIPLSKKSPIDFSLLGFFVPEIIIQLSEDNCRIMADDPEKVWAEISNTEIFQKDDSLPDPVISARLSREDYIKKINRLKEHILRGDCYEINFCQEFYAENARLEPLQVYNRLSMISPNPFSALYRRDQNWLICASPERFLHKKGNRLISQPIKGTSARVLSDAQVDDSARESLYLSPKDRSENVMIVDLVRNDLSRVCREGTVVVDELYGVYSFPQVHQMISTISGELQTGISFTEIIKACFPMGSMTGAPKIRVMQLIDEYEEQARGIFSGAVGYISPEGDFDFNVVIRSIMYNAESLYTSFYAGSGITFYSEAEKEWEECEMKAEAMRRALGACQIRRNGKSV